MKKHLSLFVLVGFVFLILSVASLSSLRFGQSPVVPSEQTRLKVMTTFYPLADFSLQIGREKVEVVNLTPAGVEPHDFEPTPQDLVAIGQAGVFVYNGAGFETWVEKVLPDLNVSTVVVNSSDGVDLSSDPHLWLDPVLAGQQVENIVQGLAKADPKNQAYYLQNAEIYKKELMSLDESFRTSLINCQRKTIVTAHNAFAYLAKRYGLEVISLTGLSPDEEPSPKKMAEIADFARENEVEYIFFETLVEPRLSETIAEEIGAKTLVFNPLEGLTPDELANGQNYLYVQRQNLANLKLALDCP